MAFGLTRAERERKREEDDRRRRKAELEIERAELRNSNERTKRTRTEFTFELATKIADRGDAESLETAASIVTGQPVTIRRARGRAGSQPDGDRSSHDSDLMAMFMDMVRSRKNDDPLDQLERQDRYMEMAMKRLERLSGNTAKTGSADGANPNVVAIANSELAKEIVRVFGPMLAAKGAETAAALTNANEGAPGVRQLPAPPAPAPALDAISPETVIAALEREQPAALAPHVLKWAEENEAVRTLVQLVLESSDDDVLQQLRAFALIPRRFQPWSPLAKWLIEHEQTSRALAIAIREAKRSPGSSVVAPAPAGHSADAAPIAASVPSVPSTNGYSVPADLPGF